MLKINSFHCAVHVASYNNYYDDVFITLLIKDIMILDFKPSKLIRSNIMCRQVWFSKAQSQFILNIYATMHVTV